MITSTLVSSSLFPGSNGFWLQAQHLSQFWLLRFVSLVCPGRDSEVLSQPDPSVELRAQLFEAHRELRGHCETQLATCRRTCPEQKCSLSDWHCWLLLFLVLLAWTVREVIGGFLRGGRGSLKTEPTVRPRLLVHAIRSGRGVLEAPTSW